MFKDFKRKNVGTLATWKIIVIRTCSSTTDIRTHPYYDFKMPNVVSIENDVTFKYIYQAFQNICLHCIVLGTEFALQNNCLFFFN